MTKSNLFQLAPSVAGTQKLSAQLSAGQAGFAAFVCGQPLAADPVSQKLEQHLNRQQAEFSARVWGQVAAHGTSLPH